MSDHFEQSATAVMVLLVLLQMLVKTVDSGILFTSSEAASAVYPAHVILYAFIVDPYTPAAPTA